MKYFGLKQSDRYTNFLKSGRFLKTVISDQAGLLTYRCFTHHKIKYLKTYTISLTWTFLLNVTLQQWHNVENKEDVWVMWTIVIYWFLCYKLIQRHVTAFLSVVYQNSNWLLNHTTESHHMFYLEYYPWTQSEMYW